MTVDNILLLPCACTREQERWKTQHPKRNGSVNILLDPQDNVSFLEGCLSCTTHLWNFAKE